MSNDTQTETLVLACVLDRPRHRYCFDVALGLGGVVTMHPKGNQCNRFEMGGWVSSTALTNENKHQDLVEQIKTESGHITVTGSGGGVSWGSGVTFGPGVRVMGVPIDPRRPAPCAEQTNITTWVDFKFREGGQSVLPFIETSIDRVAKTYQAIAKYC